MGKIKVLSVFGTRPEAIKMAPLVKRLENDPLFDSYVCITAQHRDMLDQILKQFDIHPDFDLNIMSKNQTISDITQKALKGIESVLIDLKPHIVLVHGDTTTTFSAALAAFYQQIDVGHVEAGLRTYNLKSPYPEEFNRQAVGVMAKYHFAPTEMAKNNLVNEGKSENIYVTGNTAIDALHMIIDENYSNELLEWVGDSRLILLTAHRRENLGKPMEHMFNAIKRISMKHDDIKILYPIHKNPKVREIANSIFDDEDTVKLIEPLDVYDFQNIMARSYLILTDSGGIQEEAPSLGVPVLVMRDTTERPEGIEAGTLKLVGTSEEGIYNAFKELLTDEREYEKMSKAVNPYGDGHAAEAIISILKEQYDN